MTDAIILIPARMPATRLPGKPLADIAGEPMIVHVLRRAQAAAIGAVVVATDSEVIAAAVEKAGGRAVMTRTDHASGSDRIFEALAHRGSGGPRAESSSTCRATCRRSTPPTIRAALAPLADPGGRYRHAWRPKSATRRSASTRTWSRWSARRSAPRRLRALYFTRATAPAGEGPLYHHIGLYAYRRAALERFVATAALGAGAARAARAAARARGRHAHRRRRSSTACRSASTRRRTWSGRAGLRRRSR